MCVGEGRTEVVGRGGDEEGEEWAWWEAENHGPEGGRNWLLGEANWLLGRPKLAAGEAETGGCEAENAVRD